MREVSRVLAPAIVLLALGAAPGWPLQIAAPPTDLQFIVGEAQKVQRADVTAWSRYRFGRRSEREDFDDTGRVVDRDDLEFVVTPETVAITNRTIDISNRDVGTGTTTLRTDGESHPHDEVLPGLTVVAQWRGPRLLDTVLTRRNGIVDHVTYEISDDGRTLTTKTAGPLGTQEIVFRRD